MNGDHTSIDHSPPSVCFSLKLGFNKRPSPIFPRQGPYPQKSAMFVNTYKPAAAGNESPAFAPMQRPLTAADRARVLIGVLTSGRVFASSRRRRFWKLSTNFAFLYRRRYPGTVVGVDTAGAPHSRQSTRIKFALEACPNAGFHSYDNRFFGRRRRALPLGGVSWAACIRRRGRRTLMPPLYQPKKRGLNSPSRAYRYEPLW
jgi:hypothetical protein